MYRVADYLGNDLYGTDGRPLSFTGPNAYRLATAAAYRVRKTTDGSTPYNGVTWVFGPPLENGEHSWIVERDGTIVPQQ